MRITFLGTNGWYDTECGNTLSILVETSQYYLVLDAGSGLTKLDHYIHNDKPIYLFLSHFHLDHMIGFHVAGRFHFPQGIKIVGQAGVRGILNQLVNQPFSSPLSSYPYPVEILQLPNDEKAIPFPFTALPLRHSTACLGYRFVLDGQVLAFCTDTGYCQNAITLAKDADVLITECTKKMGFVETGWPHLTPETAAKIAVESCAKRLLLVHFEAAEYLTLDERTEAERQARQWFPATTAALDDMQIEI